MLNFLHCVGHSSCPKTCLYFKWMPTFIKHNLTHTHIHTVTHRHTQIFWTARVITRDCDYQHEQLLPSPFPPPPTLLDLLSYTPPAATPTHQHQQTHTHTPTHTHTHTPTHTHTHTHTYTHTHTHTHRAHMPILIKEVVKKTIGTKHM